jgi:hypothetical protein
MIIFKRYPHVRDLLDHYATDLSNIDVLRILQEGVNNEDDAENLSRFIWKMADKMAEDSNEGKLVLGGTDNTEMLPDVEYELTLYLSERGYVEIWDRISDEENP